MPWGPRHGNGWGIPFRVLHHPRKFFEGASAFHQILRVKKLDSFSVILVVSKYKCKVGTSVEDFVTYEPDTLIYYRHHKRRAEISYNTSASDL